MKATIVLIANNQTANLASKLLLEANRIGELGFDMTRLPFHVSLKQPFSINNLEEFEIFFDKYSKRLKPVNVHFEELVTWESKIFGYDSGVMVLKAEKTEELVNLHQDLNYQLEEKFGSCKADFDGDEYQFHMTIAIGGNTFSVYEKVLEEFRKRELDFNTNFNELALFYYDDDDIKPGTYYCYKRVSLNR
jgi:2'-5' RNA ligase